MNNYLNHIEVVDRRITEIQFDWDLESRPLWRTLEELPPDLAIRWADRFAPFESLSAEWALCLAYEAAFRMEPPRKANWIRVIQSEVQRVLWSCNYFANLFKVMEDGFREELFRSQVDVLLGLQETIMGGRVLPQSFRVGGIGKDMSLGDLDKTDKICKEVEKSVDLALGNFEEDVLSVGWLSRGLVIDRELLEVKDITGPVLHACGIEKDVRMNQPYGPYSELKIQCYRPHKERGLQGRPIDRVRSVRFQMYQSFQLLRQSLQQIPDGPFNLGLEVPAELPEYGSWHSVVEAPSGALRCDLRKGGVRFKTTSTSLTPVLEQLFTGTCSDDFEISLASVGIDFGQGGVVEDAF